MPCSRRTALTADNADQQAEIAGVRTLAKEKLAELQESIAVRRGRGFEAAQQIVATDRGKRIMDDLRGVVARMTQREQTLLRAREAEAQRSSTRAKWATVATTAIAIVAVGSVWFGFRRYALDSAVLETGTIQGLANHTVLIAADGSERPIDDSAAPIRTVDGDVLGAVLVFRDISHRRADERRLREAFDDAEASRALAERRQRELEQALEAKNQFLAAVSHELRTPTNAIVGWAAQLQAGTVRPERTASAIASIDRSAQTLARLIEDLLETSRLLAGKVRLGTDDIDLVALVREAVDAVGFAADNKGITIDVQAAGPPAIRGDAARLKQVVWNILGNAIKFTPGGGTIYLRTEVERGMVCVSIRDTGPGIPPALLPRIFDPFTQGDTHSPSGLGLGLAIARQIVELHGGTIEASNNRSAGGATLAIRLPAPVGGFIAASM